VKLQDMTDELLKDVNSTIQEAMKKYTNEKEIAYYIKRE
jgi:dynein light chain LC8-type